ncbi:MAG: hypothetical protein ACPGVO_15765 [Spirulinaceae cyanobacterium]
METWEFLLQKQGTRSWLPLQTRKVSLGTGRYRLIAQGCPPGIDVEIQVFYQTLDAQNPQRRSQKRAGCTSEEGLIVIVPFTELRPGLWELRISSPQVRALWGEDWQDVLQIKVKPAPTDHTASPAATPPDATAQPTANTASAPDEIPASQRAAAYQPRFSLTEPEPLPPETNPAILLNKPTADPSAAALTHPGVSDQEAQPWLANLPPLAMVEEVEPAFPDLPEPFPGSAIPSQALSGQAIPEPAKPSSQPTPSPDGDLETPAVETVQSAIALTPEILDADAIGFEPPQRLAPQPPEAATAPIATGLTSAAANAAVDPEFVDPEFVDPTFADHPHALLEQSIQSLEHILQQVSEPGDDFLSTSPSVPTTPPRTAGAAIARTPQTPERFAQTYASQTVSPQIDSLRVQSPTPQSPETYAPKTASSPTQPVADPTALEREVEQLDVERLDPEQLDVFSAPPAASAPLPANALFPAAASTPEIEPELETAFLPAAFAAPPLPALAITLAQDTFIRHRNEPILISGHVDLQDGAETTASSALDHGFSGFLHYELRDPQTQAELLTVEQPLADATLPLVFNYLLDVPTAYATRLVLGEVRLTITDPALAPSQPTPLPLAQQTFSITAGLADLLDTVRQPTTPIEPEPPRSLQMPKASPKPTQPSSSRPNPPTILPPKLQPQAGGRKLPELPSFGNPPPSTPAPSILPWGAAGGQTSTPNNQPDSTLLASLESESESDWASALAAQSTAPTHPYANGSTAGTAPERGNREEQLDNAMAAQGQGLRGSIHEGERSDARSTDLTVGEFGTDGLASGAFVLGEFVPEDALLDYSGLEDAELDYFGTDYSGLDDSGLDSAHLNGIAAEPTVTPSSASSLPTAPPPQTPPVASGFNAERYQPIPELPRNWGDRYRSAAALAHEDNNESSYEQPSDLEPGHLPSSDPESDAFEALQLGDRFLQQLNSLAAEPLATSRPPTDAPAATPANAPNPEQLLDSDWPMQEFVVEDEPDETFEPAPSPAPLAPLQYDASGLPYPRQFQTDWLSPENPPPPALVRTNDRQTHHRQTHNAQFQNGMTPSTNPANPPTSPATPELILPLGELIAGDLALVRVALKAQPGLVYVKLWVKDCETRQLLDGPRAFVDFETIAPGELETMTQVVVPLGSPAVRFEAIAIDVTTGQESRKASCERAVVPPDLTQFNLEGAPVLPLSEG